MEELIQLLFITLLHMLPLFIMLLDMESPMLLTLLVFMALLLLLSQLFMEPMQVLEDMLLTLLELFMLPSVKQRPLLMLTTMDMDMEATVLDTESILMDMDIILDTLPLAMVVVLDTDMVMDSTDKQYSQKKQLINSTMNGMFLLLTLTSIVHSVNDSLFRSGDEILYSINLSDIHSLIHCNNFQCQVTKTFNVR